MGGASDVLSGPAAVGFLIDGVQVGDAQTVPNTQMPTYSTFTKTRRHCVSIDKMPKSRSALVIVKRARNVAPADRRRVPIEWLWLRLRRR